MKKSLVLIVVVLFLLLLSGCVDTGLEGVARVTINEDNSAVLNLDVLVNTSALQFSQGNDNPLESLRLDLEKNEFITSNFIREGKTGINAIKRIDNIKENFDMIDVFINGDAKSKEAENLIVQKSWFKNKYILKSELNFLDREVLTASSEIQEHKGNHNSYLSNGKFKVIFDLPVEATLHNASLVENEGKTLVWDIVPTMSNPLLLEMEVLNIINILVTIIAAAILVAIIFFILKQNRKFTND